MKAEAGLHPDHSVEGLRALEFHIKAERKHQPQGSFFWGEHRRENRKTKQGFWEEGSFRAKKKNTERELQEGLREDRKPEEETGKQGSIWIT